MATGMNITPACTATTITHTTATIKLKFFFYSFFCIKIRTTKCTLFTRENLLKKYKWFKQKLQLQ